MAKFSKTSLLHRATLHPKLQKLLDAVIEDIDFSIIGGWRGKEAQMAAFNAKPKLSQTPWPKSKHNFMKDGKACSLAVDIAPFPVDWKEGERPHLRFAFLQGAVYAHARRLKIRVRFGMDWNQNFIVDEGFIDLPHVELHPDET